MFAVLQYLNSVNKNMFHSDGVLVRRFVGRFVRNCFGIEDYHVGEIAFLNKATMVEAEVCSRQAAQALIFEILELGTNAIDLLADSAVPFNGKSSYGRNDCLIFELLHIKEIIGTIMVDGVIRTRRYAIPNLLEGKRSNAL